MLRRLKADVEKSLLPKTETILFTGLSVMQKTLYRQILLRDIDQINGSMAAAGNGSNSQGGRTAILNIVMQLRKCCNHPYLFPVSSCLSALLVYSSNCLLYFIWVAIISSFFLVLVSFRESRTAPLTHTGTTCS